ENPKATAHFRQKVCNRARADAQGVQIGCSMEMGIPILKLGGLRRLCPRGITVRDPRVQSVNGAQGEKAESKRRKRREDMGDEFMCQLLVSFRADPFQRLKPPENGGLITFGEVQKGGRMAEVCADSAGRWQDQLPIMHFFEMYRAIPRPLDRGNALPVRRQRGER
ncbi:Protease Do-like 10, partial [Durusdinium trenchii]